MSRIIATIVTDHLIAWIRIRAAVRGIDARVNVDGSDDVVSGRGGVEIPIGEET